MRRVPTFKWGFGALVICAGLAAMQSGLAQETTEGNDARDEASDDAVLDDERREREARREDRERMEREEQERGERGLGGYGGGRGGYGGERGEGRGGYGGGRGGGYGGEGRGYGGWEGYGEVSVELAPQTSIKRTMKADAVLDVKKKMLMIHAQPEKMNRIREAAAALVDAGEYGRAGAERQLNELLDEYFEEDMNRREEELANVERRVKELRELLERRREKKDDIIRLQKEVLQNEANGLGFFSAEGPGGGQKSDVFFWQTGPGAGLPPAHPPVPAAATPYAPGAPAAPVVAPAPVPAPVKR